MSHSGEKDQNDPRALHAHHPDGVRILCDVDQGLTTTCTPNVTCKECLTWMHA